MPGMDNWSLLAAPAWEVAPRLLGCYLVRKLEGQTLVGKIVETEAYDQSDAASHSFVGQNGRAAVTFGLSGRLYVHASRHHFLADITCGPIGYGSSVLIRALEPLEGLEIMQANRHGVNGENMTNGPAKVCQAFQIDRSLNGHDLRSAPLRLIIKPSVSHGQIIQTTRIGISKAKDIAWRFYVRDSPFVSAT